MFNPLGAFIGKQLAQFQQGIEKAMAELAEMVVEGSAGGGAVKVRVSGLGEVLEVDIDEAAYAEGDKELLEDLVAAAVRDALRKAREAKKEKLMEHTPLGALGVELPDIL